MSTSNKKFFVVVKELKSDSFTAYNPSQDGTFTYDKDEVKKLESVKATEVKPIRFRKGDVIECKMGSTTLTIEVKGITEAGVSIEMSSPQKKGISTKEFSEAELSAFIMQIAADGGSYSKTNPRLRKIGIGVAIAVVGTIAGIVWYKKHN